MFFSKLSAISGQLSAKDKKLMIIKQPQKAVQLPSPLRGEGKGGGGDDFL